MATITEDALHGEWFYLEEQQPLDRAAMNFYVLRTGEIRINEAAEVVGTYSIEGDRVVITFHRTIPFTTTITLSSVQSVFDSATDVLSSSAIYTLPDGSDPLRMYGSFVRCIADVPSADDVRGRVGLSGAELIAPAAIQVLHAQVNPWLS
jgi:hypothetical protein